ncbi:MAG: hypothetical protein IZT60_04730 [Gammaproteobacteria bacterium]|nr:hypothetical protein [Gammaproteobacteria bacterium]
MSNFINFSALAVILVTASGCQTGQYQAATEPSYDSSQSRYSQTSGSQRYQGDAYCRDEARRASADASNANVGKTAGGAVVGGLVGYAVGRNVSHHGYRYSGAGTAVGTATGAAVGHNMGDSPQAVYDAVYADCMNSR